MVVLVVLGILFVFCKNRSWVFVCFLVVCGVGKDLILVEGVRYLYV